MPSDRYRGIEFTATKRMANRWLMQGSWVISKIEGNYNNRRSQRRKQHHGIQRSEHRSAIPAVPRGPADERQHAHRQGACRTTKRPLAFGVGRVLQHVRADLHPNRSHCSAFGQGRSDMFIEPRGSQRYDNQPLLNFKLEKQFRLGSGQAARRDVRRFQPLEQRGHQLSRHAFSER